MEQIYVIFYAIANRVFLLLMEGFYFANFCWPQGLFYLLLRSWLSVARRLGLCYGW